MLGGFAIYFRPKLLAILALGFASGLPLALTASTLTAWLFESGVERAAIGLFAAVATPYALKFLWAPLVDGLPIPILSKLLGRRRGWLAASQAALIAALLMLGLADPGAAPFTVATLAFAVAFFSATQDIVIDAYRVELLKPEEQGAGAAMAVLGYRFGMIASSAGALYLAQYFGWTAAYWVMAALLVVGLLAALLIGEPKAAADENPSLTSRQPLAAGDWLKQYVVEPFSEFMRREHWLVILLFIMLYKFGDAFMGIMTNPFLLDLGFSKAQIANIVKIYGLAATLIGSAIGGWMVYRLRLMKSLWICGILQGATNLVFILQAKLGADAMFLAVTITLENLSGGMGTAAFVAYISLLANRHFTATQYALLSSLAAVGRTWFSTPAGLVAETLGWEWFFFFSALLAVPGLIVLWWLGKRQPGEGRDPGL